MADQPASAEVKAPAYPPLPAEPVTTQHTLKVGRRTLEYSATAGTLPVKIEGVDDPAEVFYIAYTLDAKPAARRARPLLIAFNGGPGSASIWLHMGALGPYRVQLHDQGWMPAPPYRLEPNPHTWLAFADLLFIDPVGTGYSRAKDADANKKFWGVEADLQAVSEFIRLYLTRSGRWSSPLFLAGESYGTTRAAGLSGHLIEMGIALSGVVLVSTILNFQTAHFDQGNDLPYALFLPTYAATARYHKRVPADLQKKPLGEFLAEVEAWAETEYMSALALGDRLPAKRRAAAIETLARYSGLRPEYLDLADLRPEIMRFCKELLRDQRRTVGRLDTRFQGIDATPVTDAPDFDPSYAAILPPYTMLLNDYVRSQLGYETDRVYETLNGDVYANWEWPKGLYTDTSAALRAAFHQNPHMKLLVTCGYYDLATPYFAARYTLEHMGLDAALRDSIRWTYYKAGHMFYIETRSLKRLTADVKKFIGWALGEAEE